MAEILINDSMTQATIQSLLDGASDGDIVIFANGTYNLTDTLTVRKDITIHGESREGVIINAAGAPTNTWAIALVADGATLENFTLVGGGTSGTNQPIGSARGIKAQPNPATSADSVSGLTIQNVTVENFHRAEIDLNGVHNSVVSNVTVDGNGTGGAGIAITDSTYIELNNVETIDNAWGGVAIYTNGGSYPPGTDHIEFTGMFSSSGEAQPIYSEADNGGAYPPTNVILPNGYHYAVYNDEYRTVAQGSDGDEFLTYFDTEADATAFAAILNTLNGGNTASVVYQSANGDGEAFELGDIVVSEGMSLQAAIDGAAPNSTIYVNPGIYNENIVIDVEGLTIVATGDGVVLRGDFKEANSLGATVFDGLKASTGYSGDVGVTIVANGVTLDGINVDNFMRAIVLGGQDQGNPADGPTLATDVDVSGTTLKNLDITSFVLGLHKGGYADVTDLVVQNVDFGDGYIGVDFVKNTNAPYAENGNASDVTFDDVDFTNILQKGIYIETLSDAHLTGIDMQNVGQYGGVPTHGATGLHGNGINLNLKNGTYSDIEIDTFNLVNTGLSNKDGALSSNATAGAIVIATRDDGTTYGPAPATATDIRIHDGTISGLTSTGIRAGEAGKNNAGPSLDIDNVLISGTQHSALHGDVGNEGQGTVTISGTNDGNTYIASTNSDGALVFVGDLGDDIYAGGSASDTVDYSATTDGVIVNNTEAFSAGFVDEIGYDTLSGIENVIGGSGNDEFSSTGTIDNTFVGGAGNDTFSAGSGNDTFVYESASAVDGMATQYNAVRIVVNGGAEGIDDLRNVEHILFKNGTEDTSDDVLIDIHAGNAVVYARDDEGVADEDNTTASTGNVLTNDINLDQGGADLKQVVKFGAGANATAQNAGTSVAGTYGSLVINSDGSYTYTPNTATLQHLAVGESVQDVFSYTAGDNVAADTDTATLTITITGNNDDPTFGYSQDFNAGSGSWGYGTIALQNSLVNRAGDTITAPDGSQFAVMKETGGSGPFDTLGGYRSDFVDGMTVETQVYLDTGWNTNEGFQYTIAASKADGSFLRDFAFEVVKDGSSGQLWVAATNNVYASPRTDLDAPVNSNIAAPVSSSGWYTLQHVFTQTGGPGSALAVVMNVIDSNGSIILSVTRSAPADLINSLAGGNRYAWFADITVTDGVAVNGVKIVDVDTGSVTETTGVTGDPSVHSISGGVVFDDVDSSDTHSIQSTVEGALGYVGTFTPTIAHDATGANIGGTLEWTFEVDDASIDSLAAGETLTQTYTVTIVDNHGGTASKDIVVTIEGTNDAPVVSATTDAGSVTEDGSFDDGTPNDYADSVGGQVFASDVDHDAVLTWTAMDDSDTVASPYGTFTINEDGTWTFDLDQDAPATQSLNEGQSVTQTFSVKVTDEQGAEAAETVDVTITINGTNDAPVIVSGDTTGMAWESGDLDHVVSADKGPQTGGSVSLEPAVNYDDVMAAFNSVGAVTGVASIEAIIAALGAADPAVTDVRDAIAVIWDFYDDEYASFGYYAPVRDNAVAWLGVYYAEYLKDGGQPLTDIIGKYQPDNNSNGIPQRAQPLHYNLLGNLYSVDLLDRLGAAQVAAIKAALDAIEPGLGVALVDNRGLAYSGSEGATNLQLAYDEDLGLLPKAHGQLFGNDVDDDAVLSWSGNATTPYGAFEINEDTGEWTFTLDQNAPDTQALSEGQSVTQTFTVTLTDNHDATATTTVTVLIRGSNDRPVVIAPEMTDVTGEVTESGEFDGAPIAGSFVVGGDLDATDVDTGDSVSWVIVEGDSDYGTFTIDNNGTWSFELNPDAPATEGLNEGETVDQYFTVRAVDSHGAVADKPVQIKVTINGTNDAPVIVSGDTSGEAREDGDLDTPAIAANVAIDGKFEPGVDLDAYLSTNGAASISTLEDMQALLAGVQAQLGAGASEGDAIAVVWDYIDDNFNNSNSAVIESSQWLGIEYARYLKEDGGDPLTEVVVKYTAGSRAQSLHDNLLTNIREYALQQRWINPTSVTYGTHNPATYAEIVAALQSLGLDDVRTALGTNPGYGGYVGEDAAPTIAADEANGLLPKAHGQLFGNDVDDDAVLSWSGNATTPYGAFEINEDTGEWTFTLDQNAPDTQALSEGQSVTQTFTVTLTDNHDATATTTVTVLIRGSNDRPVVIAPEMSDVTGSVTESGEFDGAPVAGSFVTGGDLDATDVDTGDSVSWVIVEGDSDYGTFTIDDNGTWSFELDPDAPATEGLNEGETVDQFFIVRAIDSHGAVADKPVQIKVTINGTNDAPVVVGGGIADDTATEDIAYELETAAAFDDVDLGDTRTYSASGLPSGFVIDEDTGVITGTPDNDDVGVHTITVTVTDSFGASVSDTFELTVGNTNDAPELAPIDDQTISEQEPVSADAASVQALIEAYVSDVDAGDSAYVIVTITGGALPFTYDSRDGDFSFTPDEDFNGTLSVSVTAYDLLDQPSNTESFNLVVTQVNDAPEGTDNTITVDEDGSYSFDATDFGFSDPKDDAANSAAGGNAFASVIITSLPANGTLAFNGNPVAVNDTIPVGSLGLLVFTPVGDENGTGYASFGFKVVDDGGTADGGVDTDQSENFITIDVTALPDAPELAPIDDQTISEQEPVSADAASVQALIEAYVSDVDAGDSAYVIVTITGGALPFTYDSRDGDFSFTPDEDFNGTLSVSVTAYDLLDQPSNTESFNLVVTQVNDAPEGTDNTITVDEDGSYSFDATDFGFSDPKDDAANSAAGGNAFASVIITSLPANGTLAFNGNPVAVNDTIPVGSLGLLVFTPVGDENGTGYASFGFKVVDDGGTADGGVDTDQSENIITIDVTALPDAPELAPIDDQTISEQEPVSADAASVQALIEAYVSDVDAGDSAYVIVTITGGALPFTYDSRDGDFSFTPDEDFNGTLSVSVTAYDLLDQPSNTESFNLVVTQVNDAPEGTDNTITVDEDGSYSFDATDFGFSDPKDDAANSAAGGNAFASVIITSLPANGTLAFNGNPVAVNDTIPVGSLGLLVFTPVGDENGTGYASFGFKVVDDGGTADGGVDTDQSENFITIDVTALPDAPELAPIDDQTISEQEPVSADAASVQALIEAYVSDVDAGDSAYVIVTITGGALPFTYDSRDGDFSFTPDEDFNGTLSVSVTAYDLLDQPSNTESFNLVVTQVNDAPEGTDNTITVDEDGSYSFDATDFGFSDPKDAAANSAAGGNAFAAVIITSLPANGSLSYDGNLVTVNDIIPADMLGLLVFTPVGDDNGTGYASFGFKVVDSGGTADGGVDTDQSENIITIDVTALPDPALITVSGSPDLSVTESNGVSGDPSASGAFTVIDPDAGEAGLQPATGGTYGTFTVNANGTWSYVLNDANTAVQALNEESTPLADQIIVYSIDGTASQTVTVTINGQREVINGTQFDDPAVNGTIYGDIIDAGTGDDVVNASNGDDWIYDYVGDGNDSYNGGSGTGDKVIYDGARADYTVSKHPSLPIFYVLHNDSGEFDTIQGVEIFSFNGVEYTQSTVISAPGDVTVGDTTFTLTEDNPTTIALGNVFDQVSGPGPYTAAATSALSTNYGTFQLSSNGTVIYQLNNASSFTNALRAGQSYVDTLTFTVTGASGHPVEAHVQVTINGNNDAPTATNDTLQTIAENVANVSGHTVFAGLLSNDTDPENQPLTIDRILTVTNADLSGFPTFLTTAELAQLNSRLSVHGNEVWFDDRAGLPGAAESIFDKLNPGETATVTFTYVIKDDVGAESTARATFSVTGQYEMYNGTAGADTISGSAYADEIHAGDGADVIVQSAGADYIDGGNGVDTVDYRYGIGLILDLSDGNPEGGAAAGDTFVSIERFWGSQLASDTMIGDNNANIFYGFAENDYLDGRGGNDLIYGGNGNDIILGGDGNDVLFGEAGNDVIRGGAGDDVMWGGDLADYFIFDLKTVGADQIRDFQKGVDKIQFDLAAIGVSNSSELNVQIQNYGDGVINAQSVVFDAGEGLQRIRVYNATTFTLSMDDIQFI